MTSLDIMMKLFGQPGSEGRDGIHISAQLRVDAMQLRDNRIGWAAGTMETAAARIDALEMQLCNALGVIQAVDNDMSFSGGGWTCGPWADPQTPEGEGGKVAMIRDALK